MRTRARYSEEILSNLGGTVAIVGNATPGRPFGPLVDRHDHVIRLNNFRIAGYEPLIGSRTDFRCTTGWRDIEHRNAHPEFSPFHAAVAESSNLEAFNRQNDAPVLTARRDVHPFLPETARPSCGLALLQLCALLNLEVDVFNFDGFKTPPYWRPGTPVYTTHSTSELDILLKRPNIFFFGRTYDYQSLYDYCHTQHAEYGQNAGLQLFSSLRRQLPSGSILEFGAGNGDLAHYLETTGHRVTAVEVSPEACKRIRCSQVIQGDAFTLAELPGPFDCFVSVDVLEHLTENDIRVVLREAGRLASRALISVSTRPSGLVGPRGENLHLTVRPAEWWKNLVGRYFDVQMGPGPGTGQVVFEGEGKGGDTPGASTVSPACRLYTPPAYSARTSSTSRPMPGASGDVRVQPHVWPLATNLARRAGCTRLVAIGCMQGDELAATRPEFEPLGIDTPEIAASWAARYPEASWLGANLEHVGSADLTLPEPAVVVCAGLLETLSSPEPVLGLLARLTHTQTVVVLTTPDRRRTHGPLHSGPPTNPHNVREWTLEELTTLAFEHGFALAFAGLTATDDRDYAMKTCVVVAVSSSQSPDARMATGEFCKQTLQELQDGARRRPPMVGGTKA